MTTTSDTSVGTVSPMCGKCDTVGSAAPCGAVPSCTVMQITCSMPSIPDHDIRENKVALLTANWKNVFAFEVASS